MGKFEQLNRLVNAGFVVPAFVKSTEVESLLECTDSALFSVRSSPSHSMAGLCETYTKVPADGIQEAVAKVMASLDRPLVKLFQKKKGIQVTMDVVVQEWIDATNNGFSAVVYTRSPFNSKSSEIFGRWVDKMPCSVLVNGEVEGEDISTCPLLSQIEHVCSKAELVFGQPQEMELVCEDGMLFVLQTRAMHFNPLLDTEGVEYDPDTFVCKALPVSLPHTTFDTVIKVSSYMELDDLGIEHQNNGHICFLVKGYAPTCHHAELARANGIMVLSVIDFGQFDDVTAGVFSDNAIFRQ